MKLSWVLALFAILLKPLNSLKWKYTRSGKFIKLNVLYAGKSSSVKAEKFFCDSCGTEHIKWMGKCYACGEWNTIKAFRVSKSTSSLDTRVKLSKPVASSPLQEGGKTVTGKGGSWLSGTSSSLTKLSNINTEQTYSRMKLFSEEFNRVLGGGLVKGSVVLLAGEPGVGKSTLLLQLAASVGKDFSNVVYISGEENGEQIALRARRLKLDQDGIYVMLNVDAEDSVANILLMETLPSLVIVDSIQTMRSEESTSNVGSVSQIRSSTAQFVEFAKSSGTAVLLVGHVTKSGDVAGPKVLEHMVDTVLYLEGSEQVDYRLIRCMKNRFGAVSELGIFSMSDSGMQDAENSGDLFLSSDVANKGLEGSAVAVVMEGSRPILTEIQCLVSKNANSAEEGGRGYVMVTPRRASDGFPLQRLLLIMAVIEKRLRLKFWDKSVYLNVVGGLKVQEPSADLAVAAAVVSSATNTAVLPCTAFIGEVGLGGELRGGKNTDLRIAEAVRIGFRRIILPKSKRTNISSLQKKVAPEGVQLFACETLKDALAIGLDLSSSGGSVAKLLHDNSGVSGRKKRSGTETYQTLGNGGFVSPRSSSSSRGDNPGADNDVDEDGEDD